MSNAASFNQPRSIFELGYKRLGILTESATPRLPSIGASPSRQASEGTPEMTLDDLFSIPRPGHEEAGTLDEFIAHPLVAELRWV